MPAHFTHSFELFLHLSWKTRSDMRVNGGNSLCANSIANLKETTFRQLDFPFSNWDPQFAMQCKLMVVVSLALCIIVFFLLMTVTLPYCLYLRIFVFAILECPDSVLGDWTSTSTSHFFLSSKMRAVLVIITGKLFRSHAKNTSKLLWKELTRPICFIKAGKWTEMQFIYSYHPTWRKKNSTQKQYFSKDETTNTNR